MFTKEDITHQQPLPPSHAANTNDIFITVNEVQTLLSNHQGHKAAEPDMIPSRLHKLAADELSLCLAKLLQPPIDYVHNLT